MPNEFRKCRIIAAYRSPAVAFFAIIGTFCRKPGCIILEGRGILAIAALPAAMVPSTATAFPIGHGSLGDCAVFEGPIVLDLCAVSDDVASRRLRRCRHLRRHDDYCVRR